MKRPRLGLRYDTYLLHSLTLFFLLSNGVMTDSAYFPIAAHDNLSAVCL